MTTDPDSLAARGAAHLRGDRVHETVPDTRPDALPAALRSRGRSRLFGVVFDESGVIDDFAWVVAMRQYAGVVAR